MSMMIQCDGCDRTTDAPALVEGPKSLPYGWVAVTIDIVSRAAPDGTIHAHLCPDCARHFPERADPARWQRAQVPA